MNRADIRLAVAAVLAGIGGLMVAFGAAYNPVFFGLALPFVAAAYLIWLDATGRLSERARPRRTRRRRRATGAADSGDRRRRWREGSRRGATDAGDRAERREARRVLGIDPDADDAAIRRAYRERVKETHPDTDGGSEEAFRRVTDAYDRLGGERA